MQIFLENHIHSDLFKQSGQNTQHPLIDGI
jgi:hypothetical protein